MSTALQSIRALVDGLRRSHYYCDDCWYSCPKNPEGCCNQSQGEACNCGADTHNAKIDALSPLLDALEQEMGTLAGDVVRMAQTKVGQNCEHHTWPLKELERLAIRECPLCWKSATEQAERRVAELVVALYEITDRLAGDDAMGGRATLSLIARCRATLARAALPAPATPETEARS